MSILIAHSNVTPAQCAQPCRVQLTAQAASEVPGCVKIQLAQDLTTGNDLDHVLSLGIWRSERQLRGVVVANGCCMTLPPAHAAHLDAGLAVVLAGLGTSATSEGDRWAIQQLAASGEDVVGQPASPQYLLLALVILLTPLGAAKNGAGCVPRLSNNWYAPVL